MYSVYSAATEVGCALGGFSVFMPENAGQKDKQRTSQRRRRDNEPWPVVLVRRSDRKRLDRLAQTCTAHSPGLAEALKFQDCLPMALPRPITLRLPEAAKRAQSLSLTPSNLLGCCRNPGQGSSQFVSVIHGTYLGAPVFCSRPAQQFQ